VPAEQVDSKYIKAGFSAPESLILRAKEKAGANFSAYVTRLIERDLDNLPLAPLSPTVIVDLARTLSGEIDARIIERRFGADDQPMMLRNWLRLIAEKPNDAPDTLDSSVLPDKHMAERLRAEKHQQTANGTDKA